MQFAIYCVDKPNALELRMATRAAHLAYSNRSRSRSSSPDRCSTTTAPGCAARCSSSKLTTSRRCAASAKPIRTAKPDCSSAWTCTDSARFSRNRNESDLQLRGGSRVHRHVARVNTAGLDVVVCPESDDARLFELLRDADVLWHCLRPVDAKVFDAAPRLRLVQKIGVGVNTIDLERRAVARSRCGTCPAPTVAQWRNTRSV